MNIELVAKGFDVAPLRDALRDEKLWDKNTARTHSLESPHYGCSDIWARYAEDYLNPGPFVSLWYPIADLIPVRHLAYEVCSLTGAKELGGVLITKIPAGKSVKPHKDSGWHASHHSRKFGLSIAANNNQAFCFEDSHLVTEPGDLFMFDNSNVHWVINSSLEDRITLIVCTK